MRSVVIHSHQSPKNNYNNWLFSRQKKKLIMGVRSALFYYPFDAGMIIVEEENSPSYFQPEKPYYHLVDIAWSLSETKKMKLILSGDYPSLFTYKRYKENKMDLLRVSPCSAKKVEVFDFNTSYSRKHSIFNPFVIELMRKNLEANKKILLIWSRKNFSAILRCDSCGYVVQCPRCSSPLRLSEEQNSRVCSWCGYSDTASDLCQSCSSGYIRPIGVGVERLIHIVKRIFPEYEVKRLEQATASTTVVLSTSKIANTTYDRNYNFHSCFILDIDNFLSRVDYSATFDAFIYLKKIIYLTNNNIYIFTHHLQHYLWQGLSGQWEDFYEKELAFRKKLKFPPYGKIVKIVIRSRNKNLLLKKAQNLYNNLKESRFNVFGPLQEVPFKLRDNYRYAVIIKISKRDNSSRLIDSIISDYRGSSYKLAVVVK
jgi:primosomal protein N' (replication factor Y)